MELQLDNMESQNSGTYFITHLVVKHYTVYQINFGMKMNKSLSIDEIV